MPLLAAAAAVPVVAQLEAPPSRTWNLRGTGAGTFRTVIDVSGRDELSLYSQTRNPKDLDAICAASKETDRLAAEGVAARASAADAQGAALTERVIARQALAQIRAYAGDMQTSATEFERAWSLLAAPGQSTPPAAAAQAFLEEAAGVANLRRGEIDNCVLHHNAERCIFPVTGTGIHEDQTGSKRAIEFLTKAFARDRTNLEVRWLLNVAYMTVGQYPAGVPADVLIGPERFASEAPQARFEDVALSSGIDIRSRAGGTVLEDMDGDGDLDIVMTSLDPCEPMRQYRNRGDGYFDDVTEAARLAAQSGGLNLTQTDFDNDGRHRSLHPSRRMGGRAVT